MSVLRQVKIPSLVSLVFRVVHLLNGPAVLISEPSASAVRSNRSSTLTKSTRWKACSATDTNLGLRRLGERRGLFTR